MNVGIALNEQEMCNINGGEITIGQAAYAVLSPPIGVPLLVIQHLKDVYQNEYNREYEYRKARG
ncbi:hypothetical protein [Paenibacillus planticolens]|uniref:Class IIb bacteriocin, lactobin A/cerein 7B family n=1 Tax=Paenibacillus planticolens TaxID=2654976 RepID=A0ABX1ZL17_9BACL|nr:hypothetical protein [Paenibacillus planticolens]NOU99541.1 hypothetical protein [Paenibacillus planticolens]